MISEKFRQNTITCIAPSNTFNLAGLQASVAIFPSEEERAKFDTVLGELDIRRNNCFSQVATEAAYREGEEWLGQLKEYIEGNFAFIQEFCQTQLPQIRPNIPEGTYLVWLDCRELGMKKEKLHDFMVNEARLAMDDGYWFSDDYTDYMRLNAACPRSILVKALQQLKVAVEKI